MNSVAIRRKWKQPRPLASDKEIHDCPSYIRDELVEVVKQRPHLILSIVDIPSKKDVSKWMETDDYDGLLIIFDPVMGYENGVNMHPELSELVDIGKSFYNLFHFYEPQNIRYLQSIRQIKEVDGAIIYFRNYPTSAES
jgi:hypothetical protein